MVDGGWWMVVSLVWSCRCDVDDIVASLIFIPVSVSDAVPDQVEDLKVGREVWTDQNEIVNHLPVTVMQVAGIQNWG